MGWRPVWSTPVACPTLGTIANPTGHLWSSPQGRSTRAARFWDATPSQDGALSLATSIFSTPSTSAVRAHDVSIPQNVDLFQVLSGVQMRAALVQFFLQY